VNISQIDLNLLGVFEALFSERSVTNAASKVGLSQPAFSNALRRLRELVGDELFIRTKHGMSPTPRALDIACVIRPALAQLRRAFDLPIADARPTEVSGSVAIGLDNYLQAFLLPQLVGRIERRAPGVVFQVGIASGGRRTFSLLREGRLDLAVDTTDFGSRRDFGQARLFEDRYVCLVRKGLTGGSPELSEELFSVLNHIMPASADPQRQPAERDMAAAGLRRRVTVTVPGMLAAPWLVGKSDTTAIVPARMATWFAAVLPIDVLEPPVVLPPAVYTVRWHRRNEQNRAVMLALELLVEVGHELTAGS